MSKMNTILQNTHKQKNINYLKVRDLFFDKARTLNKWKAVLVCIPPLVLILSYLPIFPEKFFLVVQRDLIVGILSIVVFLTSYFLFDKKINGYLSISNAFREEYDCNVFGIPVNIFFLHQPTIDHYLGKANLAGNHPKYETWYNEVFCDNNYRNVICSQIDNVLYTYLVYIAYRRVIVISAIVLTIASLVSSFFLGLGTFLLIVVSAFSILQICIESIGRMNDIIASNKKVLDYTETSKEEICTALDGGDVTLLRMFQDVIATNRERSVFIPKYIRNKYLKDGSKFYRQLDEYKKIFYDKGTLTIPSCASDIEIFDPQDQRTVTLDLVQARLLEMLTVVCEAFDREGIRYALDGGSLIGAVRNGTANPPTADICKVGGKFIFWDDDVDLAIHIHDAERAKEVIRKLSIYDVQDYSSETYYSPRLSNFRIRDRDSYICEKDSCLYELYQSRGLFLDVYVYAPILKSKTLDSLYRQVFIHRLYKRVLKTEEKYLKTKGTASCPKILNKFCKLKAKYLKRTNWYCTHAKNDRYFAYTPNYIHDLKKPGPYINAEDLYGEHNYAEFEGKLMPVPTRPDNVLKAFYGDWFISPFTSVQELKLKFGETWFSHHEFPVTALKHLFKVQLSPQQTDGVHADDKDQSLTSCRASV